MKVSQALQTRVKQKLAEGITVANKHYGRDFKMPTIDYSLRGQVAGKAICAQWAVTFNGQLLIENEDDFIERTVPHELAHLITDALYPHTLAPRGITFTRSGRIRRKKREVHGTHWQSVMRALGIRMRDITRCHQYDVSNAKVKRRNQYTYVCSNPRCGAELSVGPKRHKRLQANPKALFHRGCKSYGLHLKGTQSQLPGSGTVPVAKAPQMPTTTNLTKQQRALVIYRSNAALSRPQVIELFVRVLGMTKAGASTYYYNCQKAA